MAKLTLSADQDVIRLAKKIAAKNQTTVSAMFARFVRALAAKDGKQGDAIGPVTRELSGILKLPRGKSTRQVLEDALSEKYGL